MARRIDHGESDVGDFDPVTYTDQVVLVRAIRDRLDEDPGKSLWTLTRSQLSALLSLIDTLSDG